MLILFGVVASIVSTGRTDNNEIEHTASYEVLKILLTSYFRIRFIDQCGLCVITYMSQSS